MTSKYITKKIAILALTLTFLLPTAAMAYDVNISGQINQMMMYANDGDKSDFLIGDNDNSSSRVRANASMDFNNVTAGTNLELEAEVNSSNKMTIRQDSDGSMDWKIRKVEAYFSGGFGTVTIGQGAGAADGTSEEDLSGTTVIIGSDPNCTAESLEFKNSDGTNFGSTVGDTRDHFDGLSRNNRLRYDSPTFAGFTFSGSITNGGAYELAARYSAKFYGELAAAVGYVESQNRSSREYRQFGGSVSWLLPFGLNFTAAVGQRHYTYEDTPDPTSYYGKIGYMFGKHAIAVEYGVTQDLQNDGDTSSNYGIGYVVKPWKAVEFYAGARQYLLERDGVDNPDPISQVMAGTRIKF